MHALWLHHRAWDCSLNAKESPKGKGLASAPYYGKGVDSGKLCRSKGEGKHGNFKYGKYGKGKHIEGFFGDQAFDEEHYEFDREHDGPESEYGDLPEYPYQIFFQLEHGGSNSEGRHLRTS